MAFKALNTGIELNKKYDDLTRLRIWSQIGTIC